MSDRAAARRYAGALFEIATKAGRAEQAGGELAALIRLVESHAELRQVLETPAVPPSVKKQIVSSLLASAGEVSVEVSRLATMLAERDRLGILSEIERAYTERLHEAQRIVPAEVTTASPMSDDTRAALKKALGSATGSEVRLSERVDPAIVGGVIARVGSLVFDGSVTRQLEKMRKQLATNN